jgi:hypothetical protein
VPDNVDLTDDVDLQGVVLADARTGDPFDLGAGLPLVVLSVIRHRH